MSAEAPPQAISVASGNEAAVGSVLDNMQNFRHGYWAPILLGTIMLFDSWDSIAIAFIMPSLSAEWKLDPLEMGFLISSGFAGQFLGAFSLGTIAQRIGRMPVLSFSVAAMSVLAIACAIAGSYTSLLILRLVQGIMIGGALPIAVSYINELAPTKTRGRYFGMFQTLTLTGFAAASLLSPFIIPILGWRWMLGLGGLPLLLLPLMWMTLPESPRWLARGGKLDAANKALIKLGGTAADFPDQGDTGGAPTAAQTAARAEEKPSPLILASPKLRKHSITITILWFLTMFTSFGLTTWVPSIYVNVFEIPIQRALNYTAMASISIFIVLTVTGVLIDRYGRRPFAIGGLVVTAIMFLGIAIFSISQEYLLVGMVTIGKIAIFFGTYILWPYTAETYATNVRSLALGYASSVGRAASMLAPIFIGFVLERGASITFVFATFGVCAFIAFIVWITRTQETAGKPLDAV